jgi:methyltransferase (TIGR00027 family)
VLSDFGDMAPLARTLLAVRSRFTEDRLAQAASRGVRQYVMFGAGLDTFPWRQPDFARDMQIFAVDHPASLTQTNRRFRERQFARPPNLIRVPLDLERRCIDEQLAACDFDPDKASFCSALGLIFYLEDEIVDDIFRFVLSLPPPSEIVFSFIPTDADLDGLDLEFARWLAAKVARIGEPWKIRVRPEDIVKRLSDLGFREVFTCRPNWFTLGIFTVGPTNWPRRISSK